jgi:hypothetical protein
MTKGAHVTTHHDIDVAALTATIHGIADRAGWAHSLAYDRPSHRYDHTPYTRDTDAPPVGRWHNNTITAYADTAAGRRWQLAVTAITQAWNHTRDHLIVTPRVLVDPRQPSPLERGDTPRRMHNACRQLAAALTALPATDQLTTRQTTALHHVADAIDRADTAIPDHRHPPQPVFCRNPRDRTRCRVEVVNHRRQLCGSCDQHERDRDRKHRRRTKHDRTSR